MNGVVLGVCLTTVSYVLISKLIKQKNQQFEHILIPQLKKYVTISINL